MTAVNEGKTTVPSRTAIFLLVMCKGTKPVCGEQFDYKAKKTANVLGLPDKIMSYTSMDNKNESEARKLDALLWKQVCDNVFAELNYGQSGSEEPRWVEAALIAGLVHFDLDKALEEATKELPDPKAWKALARAEEKAAQESEKEAA